MGALVVTAANVATYTGAQTVAGTSGDSITAGMSVYLDTSANTWKRFKANVVASSVLGGVALTGSSSGQPIVVVISGPYNPGATAVVGTVYVGGGGTAGDINPSTDLVSTWYSNVLGIGITSSKIQIGILASGVAVP